MWISQAPTPVTSCNYEQINHKHYCDQKSPTNKCPGLHRWMLSNGRDVIILCWSNCSRKMWMEEHSQLILWSHHHHEPKWSRNATQKRKLQANITEEHQCKNPEENASKKQNKNTWKGSYTKFKWGLSQGCKDSSLCANQLMWYTILTIET